VPVALINELPAAGRVLEMAAGTGRMTARLAERAGMLIAVEPAAQLRAVLQRRVPDAWIVGGLGQAAPVRDRWADLVVSCASFGPDAPWGGERVLNELERCAAPGGTIALVGPEQPAWFEAHGYRLRRFDAALAPTPPELAEFFGPRLQPPSELLLKRA
jgi:ubiquinone/menaquinone biosynthesis C-methylase UbiE